MSWLIRFIPPPNKVFTEEEYRRAYEFKDNFVPKGDRDYDWVADYARFTYDQFQNADDTLDKKAESMMRLLGGGSGLLSLGAIVNLSKIGFATSVTLSIALFLALCAVAAAAWVRVPRNTTLPPSIAWALEYVGAYDKQSRDRFLAQWHLSCEGMRLSLRAKAWGVTVATWLGVASVVAVALSFFVALVTITVDPPKDKGNQTMSQDQSDQPASNPQSPVAATPGTPPAAPDPSGVPQTPSPQSAAGPQVIQKSSDPATASGPQTIQYSEDGKTSKNHSVRGKASD